MKSESEISPEEENLDGSEVATKGPIPHRRNLCESYSSETGKPIQVYHCVSMYVC